MKLIQKLILILLVFATLFILPSCQSTLPEGTYTIHTELQTNYLKASYKNISLYAKGDSENSIPLPVTLDFNDLENPKTIVLTCGKESQEFIIENKKIDIYNLYINKTYQYQVYDSNDNLLKSSSFIIADEIIRNLYVDGITNVRDIGGYTTIDNKLVKQGLIYRSSRFNEDESTEKLITEQGINTLVNDLKLKSEIDLRCVDDNENGGITSSVLGESVNYISIPFKSGGNYLTLNKTEINKVFSVLANIDNYPVDIHCSIGTDRTGLVCFFINACLGVDKDDLYRDYLFSNFGNIGGMRTTSAIDSYIKVIETNEGTTFQEQTINYLLSIGVEQNDINKIKQIMLE